jgi:RNA polymerase sigma-70 factor (ECF subfamily)
MAQEVFVQVFKAIDQFRGDSKLGTWIYRIAVNTCKNRNKYLSRRHSDKEDEFEPLAERSAVGDAGGASSEYAQPDQVVAGYQMESMVRRCIAELEDDFREVLILRDLEDLSYEDIVTITGYAEGTVKSRLHRARAMLKAKVEALLGEKIP